MNQTFSPLFPSGEFSNRYRPAITESFLYSFIHFPAQSQNSNKYFQFYKSFYNLKNSTKIATSLKVSKLSKHPIILNLRQTLPTFSQITNFSKIPNTQKMIFWCFWKSFSRSKYFQNVTNLINFNTHISQILQILRTTKLWKNKYIPTFLKVSTLSTSKHLRQTPKIPQITKF